MKFLRLLLVFLTAGIVFTSCQKELTAETGIAIGSLVKDAGGDCIALVSGAYKKDTALNASNYVDIQVNITEIGTYTITTDTMNGYYFKATGITALTGLNQIRLVGIGKPIAVSANVFTVKFSGTNCEINVNVTGNGAGVPAAVFTLGTTTGACTGFTLGAGTYTPGTALGNTNTVTLNVNVQTAGTYNVTATTTDATGIIFTGTGSFPNGTTGAATIILIAQPAPGNTGNSPTNTVTIPNASYSVSVGSTSCNFLVGFNAPLGPATYTITCASITSTGNYLATVPLSSNEKVTLQVNATVSGTFSITTDIKNNVQFVASGVLAFGNNTVILNAAAANNLPTASFSFTYAIAGSTCTFPIAYGAAPSGIYRAKIDGVLTDFNLNDNAHGSFFQNPGAPADADIIIFGSGTTPTSYNLGIDKSSTSGHITAGTYLNTIAASVAGGYVMGAVYRDLNDAAWGPKGAITGTPDNFRITITSLTATRVIGTFDGTVRNNFGSGTNTKVVTEGVFNVPMQ
jgi:hypothetical protein